MLLIEIALIVAAWRRGWGPRALLPLAYGFGTAFVFGALMGLSGVRSPEAIHGMGILVAIGILVSLVVMAAIARRNSVQREILTVLDEPRSAEAPGSKAA